LLKHVLNLIELPAGHIVEFLVSFINKGENDFVLETLDASFRYAMDFNFHIQNFSTFTFNKIVKPKHEVTLAYSFLPSESFAGRPFGLNVNLNYRDVVCMNLYIISLIFIKKDLEDIGYKYFI